MGCLAMVEGKSTHPLPLTGSWRSRISYIHTYIQEHFLSVVENLKNNTSPGTDLIVGYCIKNCHSTKMKTFELFKEVSKGERDLPEWLVKTRTTLAAKNEETRNPKNHRPIACENILMKTYTGTLASLLEEHLRDNNIIAPEQARLKKGMWGCTDQLLINWAVTDEVTKGRRNVNMIWLDYKKAYDSVPHAWIIEALKLAKIPDNIIAMIQNLISKWQTELNIPTINGNIRIREILYKKGLFHSDYLSVILFILSLNPLSFLLNETDGYKMAINTIYEKILIHLFFVDDLKLYAATLQQSKLQLDIVTTFSRDIGMAFGEDKCGYVCIERRKKKSLGKSYIMNGVTIRDLEEGEPYRYLGQDETIGYDGKLNKDRVRSEYFGRVKKMWTSELNARNKISAHNTFALPVLVLTFGILDWTLAEIDELDKRTRKILCMTGNFHRNSDKDRLYVSRKEGGRGLKKF